MTYRQKTGNPLDAQAEKSFVKRADYRTESTISLRNKLVPHSWSFVMVVG
jgi:hypothetical protein